MVYSGVTLVTQSGYAVSMEESLNTDPIEIMVPGALSLKATVFPRRCGNVYVSGHLHVALSQTVDRALGFLPWLVRRQLKNSLMQRDLDGLRFSLRIPNILTLTTDVTPDGVMTLSTRYHQFLARPIGHNETRSIFNHFASGLSQSGIEPFDSSPIETFLKNFQRHDSGDLAFLSLFEGTRVAQDERATHPVSGLVLQELKLRQDREGDLLIEFVSQGRLEGYEVPAEHGCTEGCSEDCGTA